MEETVGELYPAQRRPKTGVLLLRVCPTELLHLSDSYCERQLKRACEKILWQSVSVENVTGLIAVADKYKAEVSLPYYEHFQERKCLFGVKLEVHGPKLSLIDCSNGRRQQFVVFAQFFSFESCLLCIYIGVCMNSQSLILVVPIINRGPCDHNYYCRLLSFLPSESHGLLFQVCLPAHDTGSPIWWICRARWSTGQAAHGESSRNGHFQDLRLKLKPIFQSLAL